MATTTEKELITGLIAQIRAASDPESVTPEMVGRPLAYLLALGMTLEAKQTAAGQDIVRHEQDINDPAEGLKKRIQDLLVKVGMEEEWIGNLEETVEQHDISLDDLWREVTKISSRLSVTTLATEINAGDIEELQERTDGLETQVGNHGSAIDDLFDDMEQAEKGIGDLEERAGAIEGNIGDNPRRSLSQLGDNVESLVEDIVDFRDDFFAEQGRNEAAHRHMAYDIRALGREDAALRSDLREMGRGMSVCGEGVWNDYAVWRDEDKWRGVPLRDEVTEALDETIPEIREGLDALEAAKRAVFIDQWNSAAGSWGGYNEETGYFYLNGIEDITYEEALRIMAAYRNVIESTFVAKYAYLQINVRTLMPFASYANVTAASFDMAFYVNPHIEVIRLLAERKVNAISYCFSSCTNLRHVYGVLNVNQVTNFGIFANSTPNLETLKLKGVKVSLSIPHSPLLSYESLRYLVDNAANTGVITVTVHKDVYAKLTGDMSNAAAAQLTAAQNQEWQGVLTDALAKNISFATV